MASHLTVPSRTPTSTATAKAAGALTGTEALKAALEAFSAMVERSDPLPQGKATPSSEQNAAVGIQLHQSMQPTLPGHAAPQPGNNIPLTDEASAELQVPDPVAAAIDATLPIVAPLDAPAMFTGLVNDLAALKQSLETGKEIPPELLTRINAALNALGAELNIDLATLPTPTPAVLTSLAQPAGESDMTTPARLAQTLAPLAQALRGETTVAANTGPESAPLLRSIGDTVAKLAQALKTGSFSTEITNLVSSADDGVDPALGAAIKNLLATAIPKTADFVAPALAPANLSINETTLIAKPAETETSTATLGDTIGSRQVSAAPEVSAKLAPAPEVSAKPIPDTDAKTHIGPRAENDNAPAETKAPPAIVPTANEARDDAQGVTQTTVPAVRADAGAPRLVQAGYQTSQQQLNLPQLAFELGRQVGDGNTRFQIRLDPAELGKIEVRLDIDASGQVNARMTVEKSETLDLMQRDQKALERALQQAGLDTSKTNLEFSLKQNPFSGGQQHSRDEQGLTAQNGVPTVGVEEVIPTVKLYRASLTASGVNIIA